jgi:hypothetical protein
MPLDPRAPAVDAAALEAVAAYVTTHRARLLDELLDLLRIPSISTDPSGATTWRARPTPSPPPSGGPGSTRRCTRRRAIPW